MKAAVCREFNAPLVIEDVVLGDPGPGEVRVSVKACAVCYSDIHYAEGAWGGELPAVYGHEAAGVVETIGAGVDTVGVGDHVVVTLIRWCGHCHFCSRGDHVICETKFPLDAQSPVSDSAGHSVVHGLGTGAFAEAVVVDQSQVVVIPRDLAFDCASLLACGVITGVGAVHNTAQVPPGSNVIVIGTGGVGLNAVQGARIAGARRVIAIDIVAEKLEAARAFGATDVFDGRSNSLSKDIRAVTDGRKADFVFITVGAPVVFDQALRLLARGGTVVLVGMPEAGVTSQYSPSVLAAIEQRIIGSKMGSAQIRRDIPMLIDLYRQGRLKLDELITGRYPLEDINAAFQSVKDGKALRNVIVF